MYKWYFKLLVGTHAGEDLSQPQDPATGKWPERVYRAGEIVESRIDLVALHGETKWARLTPEQAILSAPSSGDPSEDIRRLEQALAEAKARLSTQPDGSVKSGAAPSVTVVANKPPQPVDTTMIAVLEAMTLKELQQHAAEEEIDLRGAKTKEDVLRVLRSALQPI